MLILMIAHLRLRCKGIHRLRFRRNRRPENGKPAEGASRCRKIWHSKDSGSIRQKSVKLNEQAACRKLRLLEPAKHYLIERRSSLISEASLGVPADK